MRIEIIHVHCVLSMLGWLIINLDRINLVVTFFPFLIVDRS